MIDDIKFLQARAHEFEVEISRVSKLDSSPGLVQYQQNLRSQLSVILSSIELLRGFIKACPRQVDLSVKL